MEMRGEGGAIQASIKLSVCFRYWSFVENYEWYCIEFLLGHVVHFACSKTDENAPLFFHGSLFCQSCILEMAAIYRKDTFHGFIAQFTTVRGFAFDSIQLRGRSMQDFETFCVPSLKLS